MAQRSRFWDGTTLGDATVAPYDAGTEFSEVMTAVAGLTSEPNKGGLVSTISVSMFAPGTLRIGPFEALVYGAWYQNDANVDIAVPTPAAATRIDTVVLRKSWAAQTVRVLVITGTEGGSAPALVQTPGVTWDVPIATVSTTTGGVSTITQTSARADFWYRTDPTNIRTNNMITVSPPAGAQLNLVSGAAADGGNVVWQNRGSLRWNLAMLGDTSSSPLILYDHGLTGASFSERWRVTHNGTTGFQADPNSSVVIVTSTTTGQTPAIMFSRAVAASQSQWLSFQNGVAQGDYQIGRRPNSDALKFAFWNGASLTDRFSIDWDGSASFALNAGPQLGIGVGAANSNLRLSSGAANSRLEVYAVGLVPFTDGFMFLGEGLYRWTALFATNGTIQTSLESAKHDIALLDEKACVAAVLGTDFCSFVYNDPPRPAPTLAPEGVEETDDARAQREKMNAEMSESYERSLVETKAIRHQKGYVLQSAKFRTDPLFGIGGTDASPESDLAIVANALKWVIKEMQARKGVN
jgi:hypothetical protein